MLSLSKLIEKTAERINKFDIVVGEYVNQSDCIFYSKGYNMYRVTALKNNGNVVFESDNPRDVIKVYNSLGNSYVRI